MIYVLNDGCFLPLFSQKSWCAGCSKVTSSEKIPTADDISNYIKIISKSITEDKNDLENKLRYKKLIAFEEQVINNEARWKAWAYQRIKGRCLTCGSTKLEPINLSRTGNLAFIHPSCGGNLILIKEIDPNGIHFMYKTPDVLELTFVKYDVNGFLKAFI